MKGLRVVIVGGGIGGFAAAIALAKDGHDITLLEGAAEFTEVCGGEPSVFRCFVRSLTE